MAPAGTSTRNDSDMNIRPRANFAGTDGSRGPRLVQIHTKTGDSAMTKIGGTDWNHVEGNDRPNTSRRVYRSANRFRVEPACSYAPQNSVATAKRITIAPMRFHSAPVKPPDPDA